MSYEDSTESTLQITSCLWNLTDKKYEVLQLPWLGIYIADNKMHPKKFNRSAIKLEIASPSQNKNHSTMFHTLILLPQRKMSNYLRSSFILKAMFAMLGCISLTYLRL